MVKGILIGGLLATLGWWACDSILPSHSGIELAGTRPSIWQPLFDFFPPEDE